MPKSILVTGGAGFIGSHLCDRLIAAGNHVTCIDDFSTGSRANIAHLEDNPRFKVIRHDVAEPIDAHVDEIFNLACPASPIHYQRDPLRTTRTSVLGALNMLDLARRRRCRILQASTSEVYGDPLIHPQSEEYWGNVNPIGPRACYDEGKRCAETLFFDYRRAHNLEIKVARIFNTYGPRMQPEDGRAVSTFIVQALRGAPLTVFGDGEQTRSFCYIDDLVEGLLRLMASAPGITGPINLGNPAEVSMRDLAAQIIAETHSSSTIVYMPLPQDDPRRRRPDIARARETLAWQPIIALADGLRPTIAYLRPGVM